METAAIGGTPKGGICRLTLTDLDRQVRDWFKARAEQLGCRVTVDDMGAMFARREGTADVPPIAFGSHLDTQPTGGKFDGVLGVLARARSAAHAGRGRLRDLRADRGGELDQRGGLALCAGDGVVGRVRQGDREGLGAVAAGPRWHDLRRGAGRDRLSRRPSAAASIRCRRSSNCTSSRGRSWRPKGRDIGVVTGVQAMRWYEVTVTGQDAHTGATPMHLRKNALLGAARLIEAVDAIGRKHPPGVATVGRIENRPNSPNVVPGEVFFMVDLRHPDGARARCDGSGCSRRAAGGLRAARPDVRRAADLGSARGALRCGLRRRGPPRGGAYRLFRARHRLGRGPRRGLCFARRAGRDDLRAVPRRHQPQRGGVFLQGAMRQGRAGAAAGGAGLRPQLAERGGTRKGAR